MTRYRSPRVLVLGTSNCESFFQVSAIASSVMYGVVVYLNLRSFSLFWENFEELSVAN